MPREILPGERFGHLVTIERYDRHIDRKERWLCRCDCGKIVLVLGWKLRAGTKKSCGCMAKRPPKDPVSRRKTFMPYSYMEKYGCSYCLHKKACIKKLNAHGSVVCKYADIFSKYKYYAEYDKAIEERFRKIRSENTEGVKRND